MSVRLLKSFAAALRYGIGCIFIIYGIVKFFRMQKFSMEVTGEITAVPPDQLFWYFFGYSQALLNIIAIFEMSGGFLMVLSRTRRIGTLICLGLAANITLFDFVFDVGPVRYWALFLTLCCGLLVVTDIGRYRQALVILLDNTAGS